MGKTITITGDGNVIGDNNKVVTKINKSIWSHDKSELAEAFALLRGEILQLDLPEKIIARATRSVEDAEQDSAEDQPPTQTIEGNLRRAKEILEESGEVFDKSMGWGKRLIALGIILQSAFSGTWVWFNTLLAH